MKRQTKPALFIDLTPLDDRQMILSSILRVSFESVDPGPYSPLIWGLSLTHVTSLACLSEIEHENN